MNPVELEMYHQIKNVIGVNPSFYEYLFTVDADTTVDEHSVNYLISASVHLSRLHLSRFFLPCADRALCSILQHDPRQEGDRLLWRDLDRQRKAVAHHHDAGQSCLFSWPL